MNQTEKQELGVKLLTNTNKTGNKRQINKKKRENSNPITGIRNNAAATTIGH